MLVIYLFILARWATLAKYRCRSRCRCRCGCRRSPLFWIAYFKRSTLNAMFLCSFQLLLQILEVGGMWTWWTCPSPQGAPIGRVSIVPLLTNTDTRTAKCAACLKTNPPQKYCWCRRNCGAEEKGSHNITFQERCFLKGSLLNVFDFQRVQFIVLYLATLFGLTRSLFA